MSELREAVLDEMQHIYDNAERDGYVDADAICDELGDYFDDVQDSDDATLKAAYALARSAQEEEHDVAMDKLRQAIAMLRG